MRQDGIATRGLALLLCGSVLVSTGGCISAASHAESRRSAVREGMSKAEVRDALGDPDETFPVPGQARDPRLVVEFWRYCYKYSTGGILGLIFLFPFGFALVEHQPYRFDVGFGADGRVRRTTAVVEDN